MNDEDIMLEGKPIVLSEPKPSKKPDLAHLDDAFDENGSFLPEVGSKVVIERNSSPDLLKSQTWLGTYVYTIKSIDPETGNMSLWNDELMQYAGDNYIDGFLSGSVYKLPPRRGNINMKRRRVSKKLARIQENLAFAKDSKITAPEGEKKRGKGRPAGVKNRPKEVIKAEKEAKRAAKR